MQEAVNEVRELSEAEIEQVAGAGVITDTLEGVCRTVTGWVGGTSYKTGTALGFRG
jgi:hypothetical protein